MSAAATVSSTTAIESSTVAATSITDSVLVDPSTTYASSSLSALASSDIGGAGSLVENVFYCRFTPQSGASPFTPSVDYLLLVLAVTLAIHGERSSPTLTLAIVASFAYINFAAAVPTETATALAGTTTAVPAWSLPTLGSEGIPLRASIVWVLFAAAVIFSLQAVQNTAAAPIETSERPRRLMEHVVNPIGRNVRDGSSVQALEAGSEVMVLVSENVLKPEESRSQSTTEIPSRSRRDNQDGSPSCSQGTCIGLSLGLGLPFLFLCLWCCWAMIVDRRADG
ncbi:hypothetical protein LTR66_000937 [Elasticomyces elasticus]|nr:hypothetical protein LTR66_000937 [Elasticomyces elasticus]